MKFLLFLLCLPLGATEALRIWDKAPYNAFTDLIRYQDRWLCVFREGKTHFPKDGDGTIRVLASKDGKEWLSVAQLARSGADLRDPKLSITPSGELMMAVGAASAAGRPVETIAYFSKDGASWSDGELIGERGFWLWRITWHKGKAYSVAYQGGRTGATRLYVSGDGRRFTTLVADLGIPDFPNESTLLFRKDGTAMCFVRRDAGTMSAMLGSSAPPYTKWEWKDLGRRVGSPHFIETPAGRILGVVRYFEGNVRSVSVIEIDPAGAMKLVEKLPSSNGDSGYAGIVWHDGELWTSYYSTHEKRTYIYFARWKP